jgi:hypothetical protein
VVENLSEEILECLHYADEHARRAKEASRFLEMGTVGCSSPTATDLRYSASALARPSLIARSRNKRARAVMREIVIVVVACFLIGIMASPLIVQLVA